MNGILFYFEFSKSLTYFYKNTATHSDECDCTQKARRGRREQRGSNTPTRSRTQGEENGGTKIISRYLERRKEERRVDFSILKQPV